jgi:hypothetical protein
VALEPAGISLQAQGFSDYVKKLDAIEKKQREAFDAEFKGTGKSFSEVTKLSKQYEKQLNDTAKAQKKAADEAEKAARAQVKAAEKVARAQKKAADEAKALAEAQKTARATQQQAFLSAGQAALGFAEKVGTVLIESGKLGAQFQGQKIGLDNLAASFGQSGTEIQSSIQTASKGTISGLDAIQAANTALLFGVAKTPDEFAALTNSALTLGRTLGLTGTQSIEQFTTALGRQSLLILDNFGISAKQVNAEIERLAQADFGVAKSQLTEAQKQATFMKAALKIAGEAAATIGEEAGSAQASFDRLTASTENLKVTFGVLARPLGSGISDALSQAARTAQQFFAFLGAGFTGVGKLATGVFGAVGGQISGLASRTKSLFAGDIGLSEFLNEPVAELRSFSDILDEASLAAVDRFKEIASTVEGVSFGDDLQQGLGDVGDGAEDAAQDLEGYQNALKQAENLQRSFTRAAEDSALKLVRANEDIARKQGQQVAKLEESQAKDRQKLLDDQVKQLDDFEKDRRKQIADAEGEIRKARRDAAEQQKRDQSKLNRELAQAQERFNLSQLQSNRRFKLQEARLIAEGDILGIKELREDQALSQKEEKENFDLSKKEQIDNAKATQAEQTKDLKTKLADLKTNLEDQRAELLQSFDEQLLAQQVAQAEAKAEQQRGFEEAAAERAIQLAREEEDRRISQARQLEDLGRSLSEQAGVTEEGAAAIADELEKVFGIEGTADNIMTGFADKTKAEFATLFEDLNSAIVESELKKNLQDLQNAAEPGTFSKTISSGGFGGRRTPSGIQPFDDGGVVPGPLGSPQIIQAHGGETFIPTHKRSFQMAAPVIPSQELNVNMAGGFDVSGDGQANDQILQAATAEMVENFRIAVQRLARRN